MYLIFVDILYCIVLEFKQTCVYSKGLWVTAETCSRQFCIIIILCVCKCWVYTQEIFFGYIHTYIYVCVFVCIYVGMYMFLYTYLCMYLCLYVCFYDSMYVYIYIYVCMYYVCMYVYMYLFIY
jgi:nuclear pore complex protein Nup62